MVSVTKFSEKVDVFSFGTVMWELLIGDEPYADLHYTGQSSIEDQKDNKPSTSFVIKNEDMVKEQDLLETNKSCLISSDPILSDYVIDAGWKDMRTVKDWKCIISML